MSSPTVTYTTAFIVVCGFLLLAPALAAAPPVQTITIPLPPLFGQDPDFQRCLTTLQEVQGCLQEIITSFFSLQLELLGPACCKTLLDIKDKCLPRIFPFDPFFVTLLKNHCTAVVAQAEQQPPPSLPPTAARKVVRNGNN